MRYLIPLFLLMACLNVSFAISEKDADKFLNNYEGMYQKFLGFFNCVSKAITGSEAISMEDKKLNEKIREASEKPTLSACFSRMGLRLGSGVSKMVPAVLGSQNGNLETSLQPIDPSKLQEPAAPPRAEAPPHHTPSRTISQSTIQNETKKPQWKPNKPANIKPRW